MTFLLTFIKITDRTIILILQQGKLYHNPRNNTIVGSVYEWHNINTKDFPLFRNDCFFTDNTVMTVATADAVMNGGEKDDFIDAYKKWAHMYPNAGYGGRFGSWLNSDEREPYNSWGNGSAMRVSPCAWGKSCGFYGKTGCWPSNGWDSFFCEGMV